MELRTDVGILHLVGMTSALERFLRESLSSDFSVETINDQEAFYSRFVSGRQPADTVVLGLEVDDPVQVAQRIHTYDKHIPILILSSPASCEQLSRTLMFSPFLGNEVITWSVSEIDELPSMVRDAIGRRVQRVKYLNVISNAQIRLEKLPLLQPEITHYLDQLLDNAPIGVITIDLDGLVITINRQALSILGVSERAVLGKLFDKNFPLHEQERLKSFIQNVSYETLRKGPIVFEINVLLRGTCFVEITLAPLSYRTGQRGAMLILQDVTDRIAAERERQAAVEDLRAHAAILNTFHQISTNSELGLGEKLQQLLSLGCAKFQLDEAILSQVNGDIFSIQYAVTKNCIFTVGSTRALDQTYCGSTVLTDEPVAFGHAKNSHWSEHPFYREFAVEAYIGIRVMVGNDLYGVLCFLSQNPRQSPFSSADLEILKLMSRWIGNELLRQHTESHMRKLSSALEQAADSVMITDWNRIIEYVNPAFEEMTGYLKREVVGKKTYFLRSGAHDESFYKSLSHLIINGKVYRGVIVNRKKDGDIFYEQKTITPLRDDGGAITHFISTGHDITYKINAEERDRIHKAELAHVARLSVLGEMASGLAHEMNQPLCAITTYAQTCLRIIARKTFDADEIRYGLEQVVRQAELGGAIFRRLRNFAREGDLKQQSICIRDIIDEVANFIRAEAIQSQVQLKIETPLRLPRVMGDPIQIEQVLLNLVRNSMDAMSDTDKKNRLITIRAKRYKRTSIRIYLSDSGKGCSSEIAERLFEPFFTTKKNGLGIGLGISQHIIDSHGGKLWLYSNTENGATFCFTLPGPGAE